MLTAKVMNFNDVSEQARKASLRKDNWFKTLIIMKHSDVSGYGYGYTYYPGSVCVSGVQAAYKMGRRIK